MKIRSYTLPTLQKAVPIENEIKKFTQISEISEDNLIEDDRKSIKLDYEHQTTLKNKTLLDHVVEKRITNMQPPANVNANKNIESKINMTETKLTSLKKDKLCSSDTKITFLLELEECIKKFNHRNNKNA